jgi:hypothetical protein
VDFVEGGDQRGVVGTWTRRRWLWSTSLHRHTSMLDTLLFPLCWAFSGNYP